MTQKKSRIILRAIGGVIGYIGLAIVPVILGLVVLYAMGIEPEKRPAAGFPALVSALFYIGVIVWAVWINARAGTLVEKAQEECARLSVSGEMQTPLPPSESLLRGATEPARSDRELLRATVTGVATQAEELLRSSD